jgi:hypothetical protein
VDIYPRAPSVRSWYVREPLQDSDEAIRSGGSGPQWGPFRPANSPGDPFSDNLLWKNLQTPASVR